MGINFDRDQVQCFRTHYNKSVYQFLRDLGYKHIDAKNIKPPKYKYSTKTLHTGLSLPTDYARLYNDGAFAKRCRTYLEGRNLDIDYLDSIGVGYSISEGRIIIPFFDEGKFAYYTGRDIIGSDLKYKNAAVPRNNLLYNQDALDIHDKIYFTEGPFDALACGFQGVANCTKNIQKSTVLQLINSPVKTFFFVPDTGEYFNWLSVALKISEYKKTYIVNMDLYKGKDISEVGLSKVDFVEVTYANVPF